MPMRIRTGLSLFDTVPAEKVRAEILELHWVPRGLRFRDNEWIDGDLVSRELSTGQSIEFLNRPDAFLDEYGVNFPVGRFRRGREYWVAYDPGMKGRFIVFAEPADRE